jgi:hypothetical protein
MDLRIDAIGDDGRLVAIDHVARKGNDAEVISSWLGYSSPKMTA